MKQQMCPIVWLQDWYYGQCDGNWEHDRNITITTIDNPGWSITIKLEGTTLENHKFVEINTEINELDWFYCRIKDSIFKGAGGPNNLLNIIEVFRQWVEEEVCN